LIYHEDGTEVLGQKAGLNIRPFRSNKAFGYLGNPKIKRADVKVKMSKDEITEYIKCANNPIYFIRSYFKIVNIDGGLIPFDMYDFQEHVVDMMHNNRFSILLQCRQSGKTITMTAYLLWYILFNSYKNVGLLANKKSNATKALARLKLAYEKMPFWLQQGVISWNKGDIELENGSKITAFAAGSDAARGESFSAMMADEIAFIAPNIWDEYYKSSYPTISSGKTSKIMLASTPNGMNHFYTLVQGARNETNTYKIHEITWDQVPGRDESWKKETIDNTSDEAFETEHCNIFLGSSNTLIPGWALRTLVPERAISLTDDMTVIEDAKPEHTYFLSADVSHGVGQDYSAISVFDVTTYPFRQVATYRNNTISPLVYPNVIEEIGRRYNTAYILVEANDIGVVVIQALNWEYEYPNLLSTKTESSTKSKLGIRVNKRTKRIGCSRLKDMITSTKLQVTTDATINELMGFQQKGESYEAAHGTDDLVMTCVNFAYYVSTDMFAMLINPNKFKAEYAKEFGKRALEMLTPAPKSINHISKNEKQLADNGFIDGSCDRGFMA